jgi:hypothetical protein
MEGKGLKINLVAMGNESQSSRLIVQETKQQD